MKHASKQKRCVFLRPGGVQCRANAQAGDKYCFFHSPRTGEKRKLARRAGGIARSAKAAVLGPQAPELELQDAGQVKLLLGETINQVRRGELDPKISNAIGYLAGILVRVIETADIEIRLQRLEETQKAQGPASGNQQEVYEATVSGN